MIVYWLLFSYFAAGAVMARNPLPGQQRGPALFLLGSALIALVIGFRYQVGGDWRTYEFLFSYARIADVDRVLNIGDPGYQFLNWAVQRIGGQIWLVNVISGVIFAWGLHRFAKAQPNPWLAFVVAVPYLVVVVAMGYTRQGIAIGILMAGLAALQQGASVARFAIYVAAAALFHKTAVIVLPLVIFASQQSQFWNFFAGIVGSLVLYNAFLSDSVEGFVQNYIRTEYSSQGALIRVVMNIIPAIFFLQFRDRLGFGRLDSRLWLFFSLAAVAMPLLLLVLASSTVVDRLSLYLIPLQMAVLPRLIYLFKNESTGRIFIVGYSAGIMFTWLNFAAHAQFWVPYKFYPL